MPSTIFTIGHSTHTLERFIELLKLHAITAIGDVRSKPYSRMNPQFNREGLSKQLAIAGVSYVFLGRELGARSEDPSCYEDGRVQYGLLAQTELFRQGIGRVRDGMTKYRLALMCAEKEPLDCHRFILVARQLAAAGIPVQHILADGSLESQAGLADRLRRELDLPECDLFRSPEDVLSDAYRIQESRIAPTAAEIEGAASPERTAR